VAPPAGTAAVRRWLLSAAPFPSAAQNRSRGVPAARALAGDPGGHRAGGAGGGPQGRIPAGDAGPRRARRAVRRRGVRRGVRRPRPAGLVAGPAGAGHGAAEGGEPDRPGGGAPGPVRDGLEIRVEPRAGRRGLRRDGALGVPHPGRRARARGEGSRPAPGKTGGKGAARPRGQAAHRLHPRGLRGPRPQPARTRRRGRPRRPRGAGRGRAALGGGHLRRGRLGRALPPAGRLLAAADVRGQAGRAGPRLRPRRVRPARSRVRTRHAGLAGRAARRRGAAGRAGAELPAHHRRGRAGGGQAAGGEDRRSPARQAAPDLPLRRRRPLRRQAGHLLDRLQGARQRDLRHPRRGGRGRRHHHRGRRRPGRCTHSHRRHPR
jgi:hypothetical protein